MTTLSEYIPARPAYTHAETVEIGTCPMDLTAHSLLVAIQQGGVLTPDVAPYRLVVHPTAGQLASLVAFMVFGQYWTRFCELALEPSFGDHEWAMDCRDRRVHSEGA